MSQVTIDDTDGAIAYGGAWAQITAPSGGNIYQNTITSTNYAGSTARYSFQGGSLTVYAVVTSCQSGSQATAQITIDVDGASNDVSLSCTPATRFNQVVYAGNNPQGNHRLTITYRGGDHPFSLDRLVYTSGGGGDPQPPPPNNNPPTSPTFNPTSPQSTNDGSNSSGGSVSATTSGRTTRTDSSTTTTDTSSGSRTTTSLQSGSTDVLLQATTRFIGGPLVTDSNGMPIPTDGSHSGNSNNGIDTSHTNSNDPNGHSGVPLGAIIGSLLGLIAIMGFVIIFLILRRRRRRHIEDMETRAQSHSRSHSHSGKGKMEMDTFKFDDSKGFQGDDSALAGLGSDSDDTRLSLEHDLEDANGIQLAHHETAVTGTDQRRSNRMARRREETPRPFTLLPSTDSRSITNTGSQPPTPTSDSGGGFLGPALGMGAAGATNRLSEKGGPSSSRRNTNLTTNRRPDSNTSWDIDAVPLYQARRGSAVSGARSSAAYTYVTLDPAASHSNSSSSNAGPSSPTMMTDTSLVYTDYSPSPPSRGVGQGMRSTLAQPAGFSTLFGLQEPNLDQRQLHHMSDPPEYEEVMGGGPSVGGSGGSGGSRDNPFGPVFGPNVSEKR